MEKSERTLAKY